MKKNNVGMLVWLMVFGFMLYFIHNVREQSNKEISYPDFKKSLAAGVVMKADISENYITGTCRLPNGNSSSFKTRRIADPQLGAELDHYLVPHRMITSTTTVVSMTESWGPVLVFAIFWIIMLKSGKFRALKQPGNETEKTTKEIDNIIR